MASSFFERYRIPIFLFLLVSSFLLVWYVSSGSLDIVPPYLIIALMLIVLVVAVAGLIGTGTKTSRTDMIIWSSKGLDMGQLESILKNYPEVGAVTVGEKTEGKLTAMYFPILGEKAKAELIAEKTPVGMQMKFNYAANLFRNGIEFWIIFILMCLGPLGAILALTFFNSRNKANKNLQNSIYQLINYIEQQKK